MTAVASAATTLASSSTVLANLAYLIGAVVVAFIGGLVVWIRHRQPKSVDANMASFRRGLSALAPDTNPARSDLSRGSAQTRSRPAPAMLTHVRIEPTPGGQATGGPSEPSQPGSGDAEAPDAPSDGQPG